MMLLTSLAQVMPFMGNNPKEIIQQKWKAMYADVCYSGKILNKKGMMEHIMIWYHDHLNLIIK